MTKRSPADSLDKIATFFENVASMVKETGGIFMHDNFNAAEKRVIVRVCNSLARRHRDEADQERVKERP